MGLSGAGASILFRCFFGAGGGLIWGSSTIVVVVSGSATAVVSVGVSDTSLLRIRPVGAAEEHDGNVLVGGSGGAGATGAVGAGVFGVSFRSLIVQATDCTGILTGGGSCSSSWRRVLVVSAC